MRVWQAKSSASKIVFTSIAIFFSLCNQNLQGEDAKELLQKFLDRWEAIEKYDVLIEADIESETPSGRGSSDYWQRQLSVQQARMDQKTLLVVGMTTISESGTVDIDYRYLQDGEDTFISTEPGKVTKGKEKMSYGGVEVSFLNSIYIKPFNPWAVTTQGEIALSRGLSNSPRISDCFCIDKVLESSSEERGTHAIVLSSKGMTAYEIVFDKDFGGMPSVINMYPNHPKLNLKDPGSNTRYFYRSKLNWKKAKDGWYVSRAIIDEIDGFDPNTVRVHFDSYWTWSDSVDSDLFLPERLIKHEK